MQKMAKLQSEVDSHIMQLTQQKNALLGIKNRMKRDYNMISGRYIKLFNGLNSNLKSRIFELDKPTIDFACREIEKISNRTKYLTATVPITQLESITGSQRIIASNIKQRGLNVINSMRWFIHEMNLQKILTDQILINNNSALSATSYIPVAIYEFNRDISDHKNIEIVVSDIQMDSFSRSAIRNKAYTEFAQLEWSQKNVVSHHITSEFSKLLSSSVKSKRIKDLALQLFQANTFQTI